MRVVEDTPDPSVVKRIVCPHCGVTIEYVPIDVGMLWQGRDMSGGPDGAKGFDCPNCHDQVITEQW